MYQIFKSIGDKPMQLVGIIFAILLVLVMLVAGFNHVTSLLGLNSKENLIIKNERTTAELNKAVEILENNQLEQKVVSEVNTITENKLKEYKLVINQIRTDEAKLLEQIRNTTIEPEVIEVEKIVEKKVYIKDKPTIVYASKKLNNKQKLAIDILKDRANKLKGNKR